MSSTTLTSSTLIAAALLAGQVSAQDNSLYADAAPEDASFVRFVGFDGSDQADFAGKAHALSSDTVGAYIPISATALEDIAPGTYATVLRQADGQTMTFLENPRDRQANVFLFLLNGTETPLDLRLADNSATVLDAIASGSSGQRGVNPISVSLGVFPDGSDTALATFEVSLKRGQNLSFVATPEGVQLIENRFAPVVK